ncbi:tyrosinase family protein [Tenacibaculum sp. ZS6-P6]|uniref:tyrosinase family protein n=1 Tax=Tenacibaculum sp. ZS6-P6 TaxID=3447503 RepID=UPI003F9C2E61
MKKININKASKEELVKIPGIGKSAAEKIVKFRDSGGVLNSFEEVKKVGAVRKNYDEALAEALVFDDIAVPSNPKIPGLPTTPPIVIAPDPILPANPTLPLQPLPFPVFESYKFKVKLEGINDEKLPSLVGYKLVVGYRVGNYIGGGKTNYVEKSKTFNIGNTPIVNVSLVKPFLSASFLEDNFNLLILDDEGKAIYDSTFQIDEAGEVEIGLPVFLEQDLKVNLKKEQGVNYEGYKLKVTSKTNRGVSGIQTQSQTFDINSQSSLDISFDNFGEVEELTFEAFAATGVKILEEKYDWSDINEVGGIKSLTINLPKPSELAYTIQLVVDPDELNNPYLDHRLVLSYDIKDSNTLDFVKRIEKVFVINALGQAKVDLDYYGIIDKMELQVKAPSGEVIGKRTITIQDIDANNEVEVKVPPKQLAGVDGIETLPERPKKTSGRVIDAKGDKKFNDVQVIIYAATKENPEEEDFRPIVIATTEAEGYFVIDTPVGYYTEAFAKVGIPKKGHNEAQSIDVTIRLERDKVVTVDDGDVEIVEKLFFPANVILVVDTPEEDEEDCDCNDCGSLDFHSYKRVVDEFSFYTVVRTTEPDIKGYTLEEDGDMSVQDVINIIPSLEVESSKNSSITADFRQQKISKNILLKYLNDKKGVTFTTLTKALNESNAKKLRGKILPQKQIKAVGRHVLDINTAIDWDEEPTIYQAITLSHGHLLQFKQEWVNDGYGMGDLLYSLPLAPGQKKQIVVYDWERRESASRTEALDYQESLYNSLSRDRDINEIVRGSLQENVRGGSTAKNSAFGAGLGIGGIFKGIGALLGVAGGSSKASSSAWQNSSRTTALNDLQQLRDKTVQSANSVRSQRGTVIQTAAQGERFTVESEVVANYNHCHSMTMQYFEVLRHLKIQQRLSSVQECLFIPLIMTPFDSQKILRWREALSRFVFSRRLRRGFDAIERIDNDYEGSDLPEGTFAEENLNFIEGGLNIKFDIPSPSDLTLLETRDKIKQALAPILPLLGNIDAHIDRVFAAEANKRNEIFYNYIAPELAAAFVENLKIEAVIQTGNDGNETTVQLPVDTSLITRFQNGRSHYVTLRQNDQLDGISRESIKAINITKAANVTLSGGQSLADTLPGNTKITITSGNMRYRTEHFSGTLFRKSRILDDLVGYGYNDDSEKVRIATPLNRAEMRNPRNEDLELANALQDHLNDNLEQYHKVIWMTMSDERRFMFLDGIQVTDYSDTTNYPGGIIRSVASVVENRVIGIVGNNLVMPVAPGFRLDPNTRGRDIDLLSLYQPLTPLEPINVSIPTKGVFAEAVMGKCNSCEIKEEDRFWKWEEHPIPDSPTAIGTINTDSRRSEPLNTTPTSFPNPIVNIQNAPDAPNPTGIAALQDLLGKQSFKDITGLEQNQKNALEALKASLSTAQAFGTKAGDMAALGAQLEAIKKAKENKMLDHDKAKSLTEEAIKSFNSGKSSSKVLQGLEQMKKVDEMKKSGTISDDKAKEVTDAILKGMSKETGSNENVNDIMEKSSSLLGSGAFNSLQAKTTNPDGSSSEILLASNGNNGVLIPLIAPNNFDELFKNASNHRTTTVGAGIKLRKSHRNLTSAEWTQFTNAITALKNKQNANGDPVTATENRYQDFVKIHQDAMTMANMAIVRAHGLMLNHQGLSNFLAWHRAYLCLFEDELIAEGGIPLPYWDWYNDQSVPSEISVATDLTNWNVTRNVGGDTTPEGNGRFFGRFNDKSEIETHWKSNVDNPDWAGFQRTFETPIHDRIHVYIGGDMATSGSPNDPIFWMHHAFIDKYWADFQTITNNKVQPSNTSDKLEPTGTFNNVTVQDMIDYKTSCKYEYEEAFFIPVITGPSNNNGTVMA